MQAAATETEKQAFANRAKLRASLPEGEMRDFTKKEAYRYRQAGHSIGKSSPDMSVAFEFKSHWIQAFLIWAQGIIQGRRFGRLESVWNPYTCPEFMIENDNPWDIHPVNVTTRDLPRIQGSYTVLADSL